MVEAVDQVLKQGQGQKQGHAASLAELPCRRLLTAFGDGRLQHALDAVAAQAAVVADAFDLQPAPVDLPSQLLEVWQVGQTLIYVEIFGVAKGAFGPAPAALLAVTASGRNSFIGCAAWEARHCGSRGC